VSLLREIQDAAIDGKMRLSVVHRKCMVLAARLGHAGFKKWVDDELNGYAPDAQLPSYRRFAGISSHGGGALPYLVGRFDKGDEVEIPSRRRVKALPSVYLKRIYYDCITYHPEALRYLISIVGADRVLFGTDYPHQVHDMKGSMRNTEILPADQCQAIREGNAQRIFKI
jgi:hypothetical protein